MSKLNETHSEPTGRSHSKDSRSNVVELTPREEFWAHCSNLQAWVENNYDTRLLHRNLAFPLLKELTIIGDPIARKVFKDEIAKRYKSGFFPVQEFLHKQGYLKFFTEEELSDLF